MTMKESKLSSLRWIVKITRRVLPAGLFFEMLEIISAGTSILLALVFRNLVDGIVQPADAAFTLLLATYGGTVLLQILLRSAIRYQEEAVRTDTEIAIREYVLQTILTRAYPNLTQFHSGELQNRLASDSGVIADGLIAVLRTIASMLVRFSGAALLLAYLDRRLMLMFVAGACGFWLLRKLFDRRLREDYQRLLKAADKYRMQLQEILSNMLIIRAFSLEIPVEKKTEGLLDDWKKKRMMHTQSANLCTTGASLAVQTGRLFAIGWFGNRILGGETSLGTMLAVLQLLSQLQQPLANASGCIVKYSAMAASAERLIELEQLPAETVVEMSEERGRIQKIDFDDVCFTYPDMERRVLSMCHFCICRGQFVALTGESGVGKSTVLKLLLALYQPDEGQIIVTYDSGTQQPLSAEHRKYFAYVPQGNHLLSGTVAQAITNTHYFDEDRLAWACQMACVECILQSLPLGVWTPLGEAGGGFSEGQIQRIAIARALYSGAQVLLLDEATSALDEETELKLMQNLRKIPGVTVVLVTHRAAVMECCDLAIKLNQEK